MLTIQEAIISYSRAFKAISDTARLDAEILLTLVTGLPHAMLWTYPERKLTQQQEQQLHQYATRRLAGEPIAYITGIKEFWGILLKVTTGVLIPRPETECLVEWILERYSKDLSLTVADLGVGSGAIALALAKERPKWTIHAVDSSDHALNVAKENANENNLPNISFFQGKWCQALPCQYYDIIVSNPPYIDSQDECLDRLHFEPISALDGGRGGLNGIKMIIDQARSYLQSSGLLILEHGYDQQEIVLMMLNKKKYMGIKGYKDLADVPRFVTAQKG